MTSDAFSMSIEEKPEGNISTSPKAVSRPRLLSYQSNSLPNTPRQRAREDFPNGRRTPSPPTMTGPASPRSVTSENNRTTFMLRPTDPSCKFQSTQTSRRRIPYTIGTDVLEPETEEPRRTLGVEEEKNLSGSLKRLYGELLPSATSQENRQKICLKLKNILQEEWPDREVEVSMFGSSGNLLYTNKSDVDICITMVGIDTVCSLAEVLHKRGMKGVTCVHAKAVPIVKIWDPQLQIACDLNVNNHVALKNTRLVRAYMEIDERVRPLAMAVKYWTKRRVINEASGGTLSSYTWTLLVINFLQTRQTPILPVLSLRNEQGQVKNDFTSDLERNRDFGKGNQETLGELFFQFFRRYGYEMDYETAVMSVRQGRLLTKKEKNWVLANNNRLCVEEPFNTDRNLGNTADDTAFRGLHLELRQAFKRIAEAKDLLSSVCEQFEFPAEEHRPIFERPQPGPRPILSRSTSQSGRGNRPGGGRRGNRQQFDHRSGANGRRSSSAAAFGHNGPQAYSSPQIGIPANDFAFYQPEDLARLSQQMSQEEQSLRYRQFQIMQAQAMAAGQARGASSPAPTMQRAYTNGQPSPRIPSTESMPSSTPLVPSYPFPQTFESNVPMSVSSSQQGTSNTNPNSPMLTPATPQRRGFQRNPAINSPGAAIRSQSQPARTMPPPIILQNSQRPQFGQLVYPQMQGTSVWPAHLPRPSFYGPYMGPQGGYYLAVPNAGNQPREYLGYGIGAVPQFGQVVPENSYTHASQYIDARRQESQLSPSRQSSSAATAPLAGPPSPSLSVGTERENYPLRSAPLNGAFINHNSNSQSGSKPSYGLAPAIVNGSYSSAALHQAAEQTNAATRRRLSDSNGVSNISSDWSLAEGSSGYNHNYQSSHVSDFALDSDLTSEVDESTPRAETGPSAKSTTLSATSNNGPAIVRSTPSSVSRPSEQQGAALEIASSTQTSPDSVNGLRRSSSGTRHNVPPLDLGISLAQQAREPGPTASTVLSPVEETRTPSPIQSRKHLSRKSIQLNGSIVPTPPTPLPSKGEKADNQKDQPNGFDAKKSGHTRSSSAINLGAASAASAAQSGQPNGQWQQAGGGKKGKKKSQADGQEKKNKGEIIPVNDTTRKGG